MVYELIGHCHNICSPLGAEYICFDKTGHYPVKAKSREWIDGLGSEYCASSQTRA